MGKVLEWLKKVESDERAKIEAKAASPPLEVKREQIERVMTEQRTPKLCTVSYYCMLAATLIAAAADVVQYYKFGTGLGPGHLMSNAAATAFAVWSLFGVIVVTASVCQLIRLRNGYVETPYRPKDRSRWSFFTMLTYRNRYEDPSKKYYRYCAVALSGMLILGVMYLLIV